jgi:hypothetical protein
MYRVQNVWSIDTKVNKTPYNVMIMSRILKRLTISGCKVNIKLHECLSSSVINKGSSIEKNLNILLLRKEEALRRGDLNPKKVPLRIKIRHKKLITKMSLNKDKILRVITSDDHVIPVKESYHEVTRERREPDHER